MRVVVINHITLDGVMQSPARADEDTRGGFSLGGWAEPYGDEVMGRVLGARMGRSDGGLLLGRWSYEEMLGYWNREGGQFKEPLNCAPKYVASRNPATRLEWPNSTLLHGDVPAEVAKLKQNLTGDLVIMGSGRLIRSLLPHDLIDEYLLLIYPLVVGSGQRLFEHGLPAVRLQLVDSTPTTTGHWSEDPTRRTVRSADIHRGDVSIVAYGASPTTSSTLSRWEMRAMAERLSAGWFGPGILLRQEPTLTPADGDEDRITCPMCGGTGQVEGETCPTCRSGGSRPRS